MLPRMTMCLRALVIVAFFAATATAVRAQQQDHVVTTQELRNDALKPAETHQANEAEIRKALSFEAARSELKSAHVDYQQVDRAIGQLSDEDLAKLAERSRQVNNDFAGGHLPNRDLVLILLLAVAIIIIVVALR